MASTAAQSCAGPLDCAVWHIKGVSGSCNLVAGAFACRLAEVCLWHAARESPVRPLQTFVESGKRVGGTPSPSVNIMPFAHVG